MGRVRRIAGAEGSNRRGKEAMWLTAHSRNWGDKNRDRSENWSGRIEEQPKGWQDIDKTTRKTETGTWDRGWDWDKTKNKKQKRRRRDWRWIERDRERNDSGTWSRRQKAILVIQHWLSEEDGGRGWTHWNRQGMRMETFCGRGREEKKFHTASEATSTWQRERNLLRVQPVWVLILLQGNPNGRKRNRALQAEQA